MADPRKVRKEEEDDSDEECIVEDMGSDDDGEENDDEDMEINEEIQVEFEGFGISDNDFHGIRQMLQQLFPKDDIDTSELANLLIRQNFIGTVLKQSMEEDMSDDSDGTEEVFGVTSCLSFNGMSKPSEALSQVKKFLLEKCEKYATNGKVQARLTELLESKKETNCLGWIINERFINVPPQVSLPMFEKLQTEISEACKRKHKSSYGFTHFIIICKTYINPPMQQDGNKKFDPSSLQFINSEEELFMEEASVSLSYPVAGAAGILSGKWDEDDPEMQPCRTLLILEEKSMKNVMAKLRQHLTLPVTK